MLEYTKAGDGARLSMIVLPDDAQREYAYGPAQGLLPPRSALSPRHSTRRRKKMAGSSISMKNDWKRIFPFDP